MKTTAAVCTVCRGSGIIVDGLAPRRRCAACAGIGFERMPSTRIRHLYTFITRHGVEFVLGAYVTLDGAKRAMYAYAPDSLGPFQQHAVGADERIVRGKYLRIGAPIPSWNSGSK